MEAIVSRLLYMLYTDHLERPRTCDPRTCDPYAYEDPRNEEIGIINDTRLKIIEIVNCSGSDNESVNTNKDQQENEVEKEFMESEKVNFTQYSLNLKPLKELKDISHKLGMNIKNGTKKKDIISIILNKILCE